MRYLLTSLLCVLTLSLTAQEAVTYPYNPDEDVNGLIASPDLLGLLGLYGDEFSPAEIMIGDTGLVQWIQILSQTLQAQQELINQLQSDSGELIDPCEDENSVNYYGYDYNIVPIGNQCWFAENLNSEQYSNGDNINESTPTNIAGFEGLLALYVENLEQLEGQSAVFYSALVTMDDRNVCPIGYHVPSWSDWTELASFLGPSNAGYLLKNDQSGGGQNEYGFSAKPLGIIRHFIYDDQDPSTIFGTSSLLEQGIISSYHVAVDEDLINNLGTIRYYIGEGSWIDTDVPQIPTAIIRWPLGLGNLNLWHIQSRDYCPSSFLDTSLSLSNYMELEIYSLRRSDFSPIRCIKD